ncbi:MAG: DMT family transporter [Bdellovibrionaceae bacterium]|nr:DMT family transporter [Pseudobdellovibrionaceae bacterium]
MNPGAALVLSGFFFAIAHAAVKFLPHLSTPEIVFFRAIFSLVLSYLWLRWARIRPWGKNKPMLVLRGVFGTSALLLYFFTIQNMPLASAVTLNYLTPVFTVLVSWVMLRERPSWYHWPLLALAFCGVLLVRGFDPRVTGWEASAGVGAALCAALAYSLVRKLRDEDHPLVVMFYFPMVTLPLVAPFALSGWVWPSGWDWLPIAVIGLFTQAAQYYMTLAYQGAPAASISTLNYLTIVYALAFGWFVFDEAVAPGALGGLALIVTSTLIAARINRQR